jgi:type I restriction enzyme M protein
MVRLSLVNLYLHGFTDPHIYEYDSLTSEERWNEFADVILANPPFMSPKGGIKPHKRFSIQAKRSEVLFVDYMAEHLTPNGRAAIIVPEGIIFQSQTAYKDLRKMLVENSLVSVVSLPSGCFNPYSGVKTSILLLDKSRARQSDTIGFFKVENDGFGLGAQRRAIEKNDLPQVQAALEAYLNMDRQDKQDQATALNSSCPSCASMLESLVQSGTALIVPKDKIAANGDYNLSRERYREGAADAGHWPMVALEAVAKIENGSRQKGGAIDEGIPSIGGEQIDEKGEIRFEKMKYISEEHFQGMKRGVLRSGDVLIVKDGATTGKTGFFGHEITAAVNEHVFILRAGESIEPYYLYRCVRAEVFQDKLRPFIKGIIGGISLEFGGITVPLPPLEVQKEIVAEIQGYQKVINGARAVLDNYRPHIPIHPDWPMVRLGDLVTEECSLSYGIVQPGDELPDGLPIVRPVDLTSNLIRLPGLKRIHPKAAEAYKRTTLKGGEVLLCVRGTTGIASVASPDLVGANVTRGIVPIRFNPALALPAFGLTAILSESVQSQIRLKTYGATLQQINIGDLRELQIPLPPLTTQQAIVAEIEAEQALVAANRELITRFEQKIQATLARIWGEENKPKEDAQNES